MLLFSTTSITFRLTLQFKVAPPSREEVHAAAARQGSLDHPVLLVLMERMEKMAYLEQMASLVLMLNLMQCPQLTTFALIAPLDRQDLLEAQVPKDRMAFQELMESLDPTGNQGNLVLLAHKGHLVLTESQDCLASKGRLELLKRCPYQMDPLDLQDRLDYPGQTEDQDHQVSLDKMDLKDHRETLDEMVLQEIQVLRESKDRLESLVPEVAAITVLLLELLLVIKFEFRKSTTWRSFL